MLFVEDILKSVTKADVGSHNFLMKKNHKGDNQYCPPSYISREENDHVLLGDWWQEQNHISDLKDVRRIGSNNYSKTAKTISDKLNTSITFIFYGITELKTRKITWNIIMIEIIISEFVT